MTAHQSLQFVEYLRQAGHLKTADAVGVTDTGAPDQLQGNIRRTLQSAALGKLWEATGLSASEFADEVARFYGYRRWALRQSCRPRLWLQLSRSAFFAKHSCSHTRKPITESCSS